MEILRTLFSSEELLQYFSGNITTTQSTKKYAATNIGAGFSAGDQIFIAGFSNAASNGIKTIATIAGDNSYITVEEAIGSNESSVAATINQQVRSGWINVREFARLVGSLYAVGGGGLVLVEYAAQKGGDTIYMPNSSGEAWTSATYMAFSYEVVAPWVRFTLRNNGADLTTFRAWIGGRCMS